MEDKIRELFNDLEKKKNIKIIYAAEAGSRAYDLASNNSDYDLRFIFVRRVEDYIKIESEPDVIDKYNNSGINTSVFDFQGFEIIKALRDLNKNNPSLIEWLHSPIKYINIDNFSDKCLKILYESCNIKKLIYHYKSMAFENFKKHLNNKDDVLYKKYFHVIRPIMVMKYLMLNNNVLGEKKEKEEIDDRLIILNFGELSEKIKGSFSEEFYKEIKFLVNVKKNPCDDKKHEGKRIKVVDEWIDGRFIDFKNFEDKCNKKKEKNNKNIDIFLLTISIYNSLIDKLNNLIKISITKKYEEYDYFSMCRMLLQFLWILKEKDKNVPSRISNLIKKLENNENKDILGKIAELSEKHDDKVKTKFNINLENLSLNKLLEFEYNENNTDFKWIIDHINNNKNLIDGMYDSLKKIGDNQKDETLKDKRKKNILKYNKIVQYYILKYDNV